MNGMLTMGLGGNASTLMIQSFGAFAISIIIDDPVIDQPPGGGGGTGGFATGIGVGDYHPTLRDTVPITITITHKEKIWKKTYDLPINKKDVVIKVVKMISKITKGGEILLERFRTLVREITVRVRRK